MGSLTPVAARAVKVAAGALDTVRRPGRGAVFLIYHRVGRHTESPVDLPIALFRRQLEWIAGLGRAAPIEAALDVLASPSPPAGVDPLVLTFDDGTEDFVDLVVPELVRHRLPAVLYLATESIETAVPLPRGGRPASWSGLRDALATGLVTIGSHTHTHRLLDRAPPEVAEDELERSIGLIGERLGVEARHFAYPKALAPSAAVEPAVRRRFQSAALGGTRPNRYGATDPYRLARSPVQTWDAMAWFCRKAAGGMRFEDDARRIANRWRYAAASR